MKTQPSRIMEYSEFIEGHPVEASLYYTLKTHRCSGLYTINPMEFQVMYRLAKHTWDYRVVKRITTGAMEGSLEEQLQQRAKEPWESVRFSQLVDVMREHDIDFHLFEKQLHGTVMEIVVFANSVMCDAMDMLGQPAIDKAIDDNERFLQELSKVMKQVFSVPDEDETPNNVVSIWGKPKYD